MRTLCDAFAATVAAYADKPALRTADGVIEWTWREYAERVSAAAAGLAGLHVQRCDTVALWLSNRPEFHVADTATIHLGAAAFSVDPAFAIAQAEHAIGDAGSRVLITEPACLDGALEIRERGLTALEWIVLVEGDHEQALTWDELQAAAAPDFNVGARAYPDDLVTLIYTAGTTTLPRGVELTHVNVVALIEAVTEALRLGDGLRVISWSPMAPILERLCTHYLPLVRGWSVTCLDEPRRLAAVMGAVRPEFFCSPSRVWEELRAKLGAGSDATEVLRSVGLDATRVALVDPGSCTADVMEFWHGLGLPLAAVYGLPETTDVATVNRPGAMRDGAFGTALPGVELTLSASDSGDERVARGRGEILMRGDVIMRGYRNLAVASAAAIDADGWLHSGDIGVIDDEGYVRIIDRIDALTVAEEKDAPAGALID